MKTLMTFPLLLALWTSPESFAGLEINGIPEPPLILYGSITNLASGAQLTSGNVQWSVTGGGSTSKVSATVVNVNGQFFYVARIPFETRFAGNLTFAATPNFLPLTAEPAPFSRSAKVNDAEAIIASPHTSEFKFSRADRGAIQRLDLQVSISAPSDLDSDHDGVPDWAESIAGTDPNDPSSVFKASTNLRPAPGGGLSLEWATVPGRRYTVLRTADLAKPFLNLSISILAAGSTLSFTDSSASGHGPFFYRIRLDQ